MEQKTEASQAVDLPFPPMPLPVAKSSVAGDLFDHFAMQQYAMRYADLVVAALKAQPAPTEAQTYICTLYDGPCGMGGYCKDCHAPNEAPSAWMAESHVGNGVRAVTKFALDEATIDRYVSAEQASFAGCERTKIALYRRPAPTEAPTELKDHNVRQLVNDLRDIAIQFHAAGQLRARISGAVGQFLDTHGLPKVPTEAAQGEDSARLDAEDLATIEEATKVLESAAKHNFSMGRTVFAHVQADRASRLRAVLDRARASAETGGGKP